MNPVSQVRDELLARAVEYPEDALRQCDEYISERARAVESIVTVAEVDGRGLLASESRSVATLGDDIQALQRLRETLDRKALDAMPEARRELALKVRSGEWVSPRNTDTIRTGTSSPARDVALRYAESRTAAIPDSLREAVVTTVERAGAAGPDGDAIIEHVAVTAHPAYLSAFHKLMRDPQRGHMVWSQAEQHAFAAVQARAAMTEGGNGAYLVPPAFLDPSIIITGTGSINPLRALATTRQVATSTYKAVSADQVVASWGAELTEVDDASPTLANPSATLMSGKALITASFEFLDDVADFATEVARLFADAKNNLEAAAFYNGNGTTAPQGLWSTITATTACRVETTTAATIGIADLMAVQNSLKARYSSGATWVSHIAQINRVRSLAMSQTGAGVWQDLAADQPASFLGRRYYEYSSAPSTATTGDYPILYGDVPGGWHVADHVGGSRIEVVPQLFGTTNGLPIAARGFLLYWRTGSVVVNADAFRVLKVK